MQYLHYFLFVEVFLIFQVLLDVLCLILKLGAKQLDLSVETTSLGELFEEGGLDFNKEILLGLDLNKFTPVVHIKDVLVELLSEQEQHAELGIGSLAQLINLGLEFIATLSLELGTLCLGSELLSELAELLIEL